MRKIFTLSLLLAATVASARQISPDEALSSAHAFLNTGSLTPVGAAGPMTRSDAQPYYVFNSTDGNGFVIISGDDRYSKVLGYSDRGTFDVKHMPPQLKAMLDQFAENSAKPSNWNGTHPSWNTTFTTRADEGVLLKTENWGQTAPYNAKTPLVGTNLHAPTGCVATAMAIIMKYHKWPETYNWDAMPTNVQVGVTPDENNDVAELMSIIGQSVNMKYGAASSVAPSSAIPFKNTFNYSPSCEYFEKDYITDNSKWEELIKGNLDAGYPVYYTGTDYDNLVGHAFVIDGYNATGFHVNWGWDGYFNGYYALDNLASDPEGGFSSSFNYSADNGMIFNIIPDKSGKKHSPLSVDYGVGNNPPKNMPPGYNINISVSEVEKGKPFTFIVHQIGVVKGYSGEFGIGLISKDDEIKEVLKSDEIRNYGYNYRTKIENHNLQFTVDIDPSDRVQLLAKKNGETEYLPVPGSNYGYSSLPVIGNTPQYAKINVKVGKDLKFYYSDNGNYYWNGVGSQFNPLGEGEHEITKVLKGTLFTPNFSTHSSLSVEAFPFIGIITETMPDGSVRVAQRGMTEDTRSGAFAPFVVYGDVYDIEGYYNIPTTSDTWEKKIDLAKGGTLKSVLSEADAMTLKTLTLTGVMNAIDFWYIRERCICLKELDLSGIDNIEEVTATDTELPIIGAARELFWQKDFLPDNALYNHRGLETVILPPGLKGIGGNALNNLALRSITIPASVEEINSQALRSNYNGILKYITMLNPVPVEIDSYVLPSTNKPIIYVPEGSLEAYTSAEIWKDYTIREGVAPETRTYDEMIGNIVYHVEDGQLTIKGCYKPVDIVIPNEVEIKGQTYKVTSIPNNLFQECESLKSIVIGDQITTLGTNVFSRCSNLESVTLGKGLKSLPEGTFNGCSNLVELVIPANIEDISSNAFVSTGKLKNITVEDSNPNYMSFEGALYSKQEEGGLILIHMPAGKEGKAVLSPDCKLVKSGAIYSSTLNSIEFNEGSEIETSGVTIRGEETIVTLPKDIILNPGAFEYCQIRALILKSTPKITSEAFTSSSPGNVIIDSDEENVNLDGLFAREYALPILFTTSVNKNFTLSAKHSVLVPFGAEKNFSGYDEGSLRQMWKMTVDKDERLMKVTPLLYDYDFQITSVKVNGKEAEPAFGAYVLPEGDEIELEVVFSVHGVDNLTTHYDADFYASLPSESIELNKTVTVDELVYDCENDEAVVSRYSGESADIVIPDEIEEGGKTYPVTKIASSAFSWVAIESVVIPDGVSEIGSWAFEGTALKEISLPAGIQVGYGAFNNCESLETVRFNGDLGAQDVIFGDCPALRHLVLDNKEVLDIEPLFIAIPQNLSLYSPSLDANYRCNADVVIYVPGAALEHHLATRASEVKEMWTFGVNRKIGKFEIVPVLEGLTIDEVIVNGEPIEPEGNDYDLPQGDNVDIKVVYTLPNGHKLETHYTPEFISELPNKVLQSDINGINTDSDSVGTVYGIDGKFYMKGSREEVVRKLSTGIYIYRCGSKSEKIVVR